MTPNDIYYEMTRNQCYARDLEGHASQCHQYYTGKVDAYKEMGAKLHGSNWQNKVSDESKKIILKQFGFDLIQCGFTE
jgi:hypothetical protein